MGMVTVSGLMLWPSAVMSDWLVVTRAWLFTLVAQLARNDGVLKKPMRGTSRTIDVAVRSAGTS